MPVKPLAPVLNGSHPQARGLLIALPFCERGSATLRDLGPSHYSATLYGSPTWGVGQHGVDLTFGATSMYGSIAGGSVGYTAAVDQITAECWFWYNGTPPISNSAFLYNRGANAGWIHHAMAMRTDGKISGWCTGSDGTTKYITYATVLSLGYYHVVLTRLDRAMEFWVNGIRRGKETLNADGWYTASSTESFNFGGCWLAGETNRALPGALASLRVWDRCLTEGEIMRLYADPWGMYRTVRRVVGMVPAAASSRLLLRMMTEGLYASGA